MLCKPFIPGVVVMIICSFAGGARAELSFDLRFDEGMSQASRQGFERAAAVWSDIVVDDVQVSLDLISSEDGLSEEVEAPWVCLALLPQRSAVFSLTPYLNHYILCLWLVRSRAGPPQGSTTTNATTKNPMMKRGMRFTEMSSRVSVFQMLELIEWNSQRGEDIPSYSRLVCREVAVDVRQSRSVS